MSDTLLSLAALWFVAVLTPGPNMLFFSGMALSSSARALAAAGAGIVLGTGLWGFAGLFGLLWLLEAVPTLVLAVKIAGGAYLAWIGLKILRGSLARPQPAEGTPPERSPPPLSPARAFSLGLATNLANPKSLVFVTSLFAVTRIAEAPLAVGLLGVGIMMAMSASSYVLFGLTLKLAPVGRGPGCLKRALGIALGPAMMACGARMARER